MVQEHRGEYASEWATIGSIAAKIGCTAETLRSWVRRAERDQGLHAGPTTDERERMKALERENRELRQANEILRKASAYFAQAELDRRFRPRSRSSTITAPRTGSSRSAKSCRSPLRRIAPMLPGASITASCSQAAS
jgi:transposase